jgi:hypothetical protein
VPGDDCGAIPCPPVLFPTLGSRRLGGEAARPSAPLRLCAKHRAEVADPGARRPGAGLGRAGPRLRRRASPRGGPGLHGLHELRPQAGQGRGRRGGDAGRGALGNSRHPSRAVILRCFGASGEISFGCRAARRWEDVSPEAPKHRRCRAGERMTVYIFRTPAVQAELGNCILSLFSSNRQHDSHQLELPPAVGGPAVNATTTNRPPAILPYWRACGYFARRFASRSIAR